MTLQGVGNNMFKHKHISLMRWINIFVIIQTHILDTRNVTYTRTKQHVGAAQPGWDRIFYFVGANTFSKKFRPKQRKSDATKDFQNSGNLGMSSCDKKFLTVAWNLFLWQEVSFCEKIFFLPVTGHFCLWQEISSCDKKFLPVTRYFFLWQEISNYSIKFLPVTRSFFLWPEISSNAKNFFEPFP